MNGYVFLKRGLYLRYTENHTHTGRHAQVEWVEDLSQASLHYAPASTSCFREAIQGAVCIPAREIRTVVLEE